ncbi:MAG: YdcF family protein [Actinobacteria bacterium]|nr:YdcF family protein [Actinomycetota bacterium]
MLDLDKVGLQAPDLDVVAGVDAPDTPAVAGARDTVGRMNEPHAAPDSAPPVPGAPGAPGAAPGAAVPASRAPAAELLAPTAIAQRAASAPKTRHWLPAAAARGLALFIGVFTLSNVVGSWHGETLVFNVWWIAVPLTGWVTSAVLLATVGVAFVAYAVAPRMRPWRRWTTLALFAFFAAVAVYNAVDFYLVWRAGDIAPRVPLPFSLVVALLLGFVTWAAARAPAPRRRRWAAAAVLVCVTAVCVVLFPLAQVLFFGTTDYRRAAPIAVVFGAQVHENGAPSTSLRDRMVTAVDLYKDRLVKKIIVSGGVGDSGYNEALVMRDMAVKAGVRKEDIIVDSSGVNTEATVRNSIPFFGAERSPRVLAVSQFYHLPRIKLAYQREGVEALTVPAGTSTPIKETPYLVAREVPAFWVYYLRAIFG